MYCFQGEKLTYLIFFSISKFTCLHQQFVESFYTFKSFIFYFHHMLVHHRIANDNGYIIVGTDWRGMTRYDLPVIIRCLISRPDYFHAIRDVS